MSKKDVSIVTSGAELTPFPLIVVEPSHDTTLDNAFRYPSSSSPLYMDFITL